MLVLLRGLGLMRNSVQRHEAPLNTTLLRRRYCTQFAGGA